MQLNYKKELIIVDLYHRNVRERDVWPTVILMLGESRTVPTAGRNKKTSVFARRDCVYSRDSQMIGQGNPISFYCNHANIGWPNSFTKVGNPLPNNGQSKLKQLGASLFVSRDLLTLMESNTEKLSTAPDISTESLMNLHTVSTKEWVICLHIKHSQSQTHKSSNE
jgi:hypothetical protein